MIESVSVFKNNVYQAGDDWLFYINVDSFSLDTTGYTLSYVFKKQGLAPIIITSSSVAGNIFTFSIPAATTTAYKAGLYTISAFLTSPLGIKTTLGYSEALIKADLTAEGVNDPRSPNKKALHDIEKCLADGAGSDVQEYTIGSTTMRLDRKGLLDLRAFYMQRVRMEDGKPSIGSVYFNL